VAALGLDWAEEDVTVAPGEDGEVGAGFELEADPDLVGDDDLASDREGRSHRKRRCAPPTGRCER
jgi:hypothetical protein